MFPMLTSAMYIHICIDMNSKEASQNSEPIIMSAIVAARIVFRELCMYVFGELSCEILSNKDKL